MMAIQADWLIAKMAQWAPPETAETWDNAGLLTGDKNQPVQKVLVALDLSEAVLREAVDGCFDFVITHHPLIFRPIKRVTAQDVLGKKIMTMIQHKIGLYAAHTNLDMAEGGVNDALFEQLSLVDKKRPISDAQKDAHIPGRIGCLPKPMPLQSFAALVKTRLALSYIQFTGTPEANIHTVGLCGGSGMEYWRAFKAQGCDAFVTGDVRYHDAQDALEAGLPVIDATHYASESLIMDVVASRLRHEAQKDGVSLDIQVSSASRSVFRCV